MWGIDTANYTHTGLLDEVIRLWGKPGFVGKYLPDFASELGAELANLKALNIPVLCLWNGDPDGRYTGWDYETGATQGHAATAAWRASGAPLGTAIYTDVEQPWLLSEEYARGWIEAVHADGFTPGLYINPEFGNQHGAAYGAARVRTATLPCVYFTSQNEVFRNENSPVATFRSGVGQGDWASVVPGYEAECVVWQSWEMPPSNRNVDLDCASDRGMALMWHWTPPAPPPPPYLHVLDRAALKTAPNHTSAVAIDPQHVKVILEAGAMVAPTGKVATTAHEGWVEVHLTRGEAVVHGWLPRAVLA